MAKEKQNSSNATLVLPDASAPGTHLDLLAGVAGIDDLTLDDDGIGHVAPEEIKLSIKSFNAKARLSNGDPVPPNQFYDTVTGEIQRELSCILIKRHSTNVWSTYDATTESSTIHCQSFDCVTGVMENGERRPCQGCPDAKWESIVQPDGKTKRARRCSPVQNVFGVEMPSMQPFMIRFRKTSLPVIQTYLSRYHIGRRQVRNKQTGKSELKNYPLYSFAAKLSLKMSDGKNPYAIPIMERGEVLSADLIEQGVQTAHYVTEHLIPKLGRFIEQDASLEASEGDTSFDPATMGGGEGKDFVDVPASAPASAE